nr:MAG TPA: hypothetical protein [Bacteriophage sp.]
MVIAGGVGVAFGVYTAKCSMLLLSSRQSGGSDRLCRQYWLLIKFVIRTSLHEQFLLAFAGYSNPFYVYFSPRVCLVVTHPGTVHRNHNVAVIILDNSMLDQDIAQCLMQVTEIYPASGRHVIHSFDVDRIINVQWFQKRHTLCFIFPVFLTRNNHHPVSGSNNLLAVFLRHWGKSDNDFHSQLLPKILVNSSRVPWFFSKSRWHSCLRCKSNTVRAYSVAQTPLGCRSGRRGIT